MHWMKRGIAAGTALAVLAVCAACQSGGDAYELYKTATERYAACEAVDVVIEMTLTQEGMNSVTTVPSTVEIQASNTPPASRVVTTTQQMGQTSTFTTYLYDGYLYTDRQGVKTKSKQEEDDAASDVLDQSGAGATVLPGVTEEMLRGAEVAREDGETVLRATVASGALGELRAFLLDLVGTTESDAEAMQLTFSDVQLEFRVASDGMLAGYGLDFSVDYQQETTDVQNPQSTVSVPMKIHYDLMLTVRATGEAVQVDAPEDPDSFEEVAASDEDQLTAEVNALYALLFDEDGQPVEDFDALLEQLESAYSQEAVAEIRAYRDKLLEDAATSSEAAG